MTDPAATGPESTSSAPAGGDGRRPRRGGFVLGAVLVAVAAMAIAHQFGWHHAAWRAVGWQNMGWQNMGWHTMGWQTMGLGGHWWAAFLLIPGVSLLVSAIRRYRGLGEADGRVIARGIGGVLLTGFALKLFFGIGGHLLGGHMFWPLLLVAGVVLLTRHHWRRRMS